MKSFSKVVLSLVCVAAISACSGSLASSDEMEIARTVANANAKFNAIKWRGDNGFENLTVYGRGDSTQQPKCPQGDGWASIDLLDENKRAAVKLKCSTFSASVGCYAEKDFAARPQLSNQENTCSNQVSYPMKKLEN